MRDATKATARLGNVEIQCVDERQWRVQRNGATVAGGLTFAQVLQIVRGELAIDSLQQKKAVNDGR